MCVWITDILFFFFFKWVILNFLVGGKKNSRNTTEFNGPEESWWGEKWGQSIAASLKSFNVCFAAWNSFLFFFKDSKLAKSSFKWNRGVTPAEGGDTSDQKFTGSHFPCFHPLWIPSFLTCNTGAIQLAIRPVTSVIPIQTYKCTLTETHTHTNTHLTAVHLMNTGIFLYDKTALENKSPTVKNLSYCSLIGIFNERNLWNNFFVVFECYRNSVCFIDLDIYIYIYIKNTSFFFNLFFWKIRIV